MPNFVPFKNQNQPMRSAFTPIHQTVTVNEVLKMKQLAFARDNLSNRYISTNAKTNLSPNARISAELIFPNYKQMEKVWMALRRIASSNECTGIINSYECGVDQIPLKTLLTKLQLAGLLSSHSSVPYGSFVVMNTHAKQFIKKDCATLYLAYKLINKRPVPDELYYDVVLQDNFSGEPITVDAIRRCGDTVDFYLVVLNPNVGNMQNYVERIVNTCNRLKKNVSLVLSPSVNAAAFRSYIAAYLKPGTTPPQTVTVNYL